MVAVSVAGTNRVAIRESPQLDGWPLGEIRLAPQAPVTLTSTCGATVPLIRCMIALSSHVKNRRQIALSDPLECAMFGARPACVVCGGCPVTTTACRSVFWLGFCEATGRDVSWRRSGKISVACGTHELDHFGHSLRPCWGCTARLCSLSDRPRELRARPNPLRAERHQH